MEKDEILQMLRDFGAAVWDALKSGVVIVGAQLGKFFTWAAQGISAKLSTITLPMLPTMMKLFSNKGVNKGIFFTLLTFLCIMNILAFMGFGTDKHRAKHSKYRLSERKLMRYCFLGGAAGGLAGMLIFRHKTLHKKFSVGIPLLFAIQLILYSFILGFLGFWAFF